ncbi:MAG: cell division protein ZapE [Gammaproteobacteria bacterium]|nr:cell division protein ZapE [Gammaproteobacteria bacterium]
MVVAVLADGSNMVAVVDSTDSLSPIECYRNDLAAGMHADAAQAQAMDYLQGIYFALKQPRNNKTGWLGRLLPSKEQSIRGLYLWGGVGRGKTYLMDTFYECVEVPQKRRVHFHHFIKEIHEQLSLLPKSPNPLSILAARLAEKYRLLCLDEFFVDDIADAMLLVGLLPELFRLGVVLVTTSNIEADELYKNGLQRLHFLQVIDEIKQHTHVVKLAGGTDYRLKLLERAGTYHRFEEPEQAELFLSQQFQQLVPEHERVGNHVQINHRQIAARGLSLDQVWFDFTAICETPRSAADYVEIAREYHTVLIGPVPQMGEAKEDVAKRFMHMIDAFYDHNVKLIIAAMVDPDDLYCGRRIKDGFLRTSSRLHEMGSKAYLCQPHRI